MGQLYLDGELKETVTGDSEDEVREKLIKEEKKYDVFAKWREKKSSIGKIPEKGAIVEISGLEYEITSVDKVKGRFVAQIRKPK